MVILTIHKRMMMVQEEQKAGL